MSDQPMRASSEDWCEKFPDEGHYWMYTHHAGEPLITTRTCMMCKFDSVQPIREAWAEMNRTASRAIKDLMAEEQDHDKLRASMTYIAEMMRQTADVWEPREDPRRRFLLAYARDIREVLVADGLDMELVRTQMVSGIADLAARTTLSAAEVADALGFGRVIEERDAAIRERDDAVHERDELHTQNEVLRRTLAGLTKDEFDPNSAEAIKPWPPRGPETPPLHHKASAPNAMVNEAGEWFFPEDAEDADAYMYDNDAKWVNGVPDWYRAERDPR